MNYIPHHTAISVRNLKKTLAFYSELGFQEVHRYDDPDRVGVKLQLGSYILEIFAFNNNHDKPELKSGPGNDIHEVGIKHMAVAVADVDEALADLRDKGLADNTTIIHTKGDARFFFIKDPDGLWVEIIKDDRY